VVQDVVYGGSFGYVVHQYELEKLDQLGTRPNCSVPVDVVVRRDKFGLAGYFERDLADADAEECHA